MAADLKTNIFTSSYHEYHWQYTAYMPAALLPGVFTFDITTRERQDIFRRIKMTNLTTLSTGL